MQGIALHEAFDWLIHPAGDHLDPFGRLLREPGSIEVVKADMMRALANDRVAAQNGEDLIVGLGSVQLGRGLVQASGFAEGKLSLLEEAGVLDGNGGLAGNSSQDVKVALVVKVDDLSTLQDHHPQDLGAVKEGNAKPGNGRLGIAQGNEFNTQAGAIFR